MVINMSTRSTMSTILCGHANGDCTHSNDSTNPTGITVVGSPITPTKPWQHKPESNIFGLSEIMQANQRIFWR